MTGSHIVGGESSEKRGIGAGSGFNRGTAIVLLPLNQAEHATIEIDDSYSAGLDGLDDFDYAWLLTWLHKPRDDSGHLYKAARRGQGGSDRQRLRH